MPEVKPALPPNYALGGMGSRVDRGGATVKIPTVAGFRQFLTDHARVKTGSGYGAYSFAGRELLGEIVDVIDRVLRDNLKDTSLAICGGAQFGKTILVLNLKAYALGVLFRNVGYYLPDDDLVQGIVDTKLRPDVLDQIPWLARLVHVGKALNESGKAVNRKGAFMVTDGQRSAQAYVRGMGKIPTSFSMDILIEDEKDDIPPAKAKFLSGRLTSSDLRLRISIGTQRLHGAGQNREFAEGTQHVGMIPCACGASHNPEESWPQLCRVAMDGTPAPTDPRLTYEGDFKVPGANFAAATYSPEAQYYLACTECGAALDRTTIRYVARVPEREKLRKWSFRISQLGTAAIDLIQVVADWQNAVRDPDCMAAFCCDRLALPKSTSQALTPEVLERARREPYSLTLVPRPQTRRFAGLDTGDRCWFAARSITSPARKQIDWLEQLSAERVRARVPQLFHQLDLQCLFVDAGPLRDLARDLCLVLNGLVDFVPPKLADPERAYIAFPGGLIWDGGNQRWKNLRCAAVEFVKGHDQGIRHVLGVTQDGLLYPKIQCNRNETIQRAVNELLTADEGVIEVIDGRLRTEPILRLPMRGPGEPKVLETFDQHLLTGSRKEKDKAGKEESFVDQVENHFLLADAYACLAEVAGGARVNASLYLPRAIPRGGGRSLLKRTREVLA